MLEIGRMRRLLESKAAKRFLERILTIAERDMAIAHKARLAEYVAGRFAAKEAIVKAFGCGIGQLVGFQDIAVLPDSLGKPLCSLSPNSLSRLGYAANELRVHLSISHTMNIAAAYVVVEQMERV